MSEELEQEIVLKPQFTYVVTEDYTYSIAWHDAHLRRGQWLWRPLAVLGRWLIRLETVRDD